LRNQYRRDGLGAELVAVTAKRVVSKGSDEIPWSETPFPAITAVARFPGETLEQVLSTYQVEVIGYDPYRQDSVDMAGVQAPLAATSRRAMACGWRVSPTAHREAETAKAHRG